MIGTLKRGLLKLAQSAAQELTCPRCQHRFKPFTAAPPETFAELTKAVPCPKCAHTFRFDDGVKASVEAKANPPGPFPKPVDSRIEMVAENGAWLYQIPRPRKWHGLLWMALMWNLIVGVILTALILEPGGLRQKPAELLLMGLFPAVGLGLLYAGLRLSFACHQLALGPQTVRLRRKVFLHKDYELPVSDLTDVRKKEFYSQNYQPIYGIEIAAGERKIRFGSALTEDEKNWLCWQIREFARQRGAPLV